MFVRFANFTCVSGDTFGRLPSYPFDRLISGELTVRDTFTDAVSWEASNDVGLLYLRISFFFQVCVSWT